jgi:flagellar basal body-associated protein FliL
MADAELDSKQSGKLQRFMLPILSSFCVTGVLGLFVVGYFTLTTPEPPPEDINQIIKKATAGADEKAAIDQATEGVATDQPTELTGGQFDFNSHRYYSFPLPFVSNIAGGKGMLTVEIAIATYGNTLNGEETIKKLETLNPKMRSAINLRLAEQKLADIDSVGKRKKLTNQLLDDIRLIVDKPNIEKPSPITDLHFVKFVISEAF